MGEEESCATQLIDGDGVFNVAAARTKNYSGAELEGVVKSAVSFALNRQLSLDDLTKQVEEENIKVTMEDFLNALQEVIPEFGASTDDLERCRLHGMVDCGDRHKHIYQRAMLLAEQVKVSIGSPLITCLLEGTSGSGKTALAATVGIDSDFPYVKIVSAESMIGLHESTKCAQIIKVVGVYMPIGPRFSNLISQTLLVLLKRLPPKVIVFVAVQVLVYFIVSSSSDIFSDTKQKRSDSFKLARSASVCRILAVLADLPSEGSEVLSAE
ncbi:hypothetical protein K1719_023029 [Acacia pycnantha]|nr:hypothetical protein K1719_023029 [Acacia pycnantha]